MRVRYRLARSRSLGWSHIACGSSIKAEQAVQERGMVDPWFLRLARIRLRQTSAYVSESKTYMPRKPTFWKALLAGTVSGFGFCLLRRAGYAWSAYTLCGAGLGVVLMLGWRAFRYRRAIVAHLFLALCVLMVTQFCVSATNPRLSILRVLIPSLGYGSFGTRSSSNQGSGAPQTENLDFDGKMMTFTVVQASAISGSSTQRTLIFSRPIVVKNGEVHDLNLDSNYPILIQGSTRHLNVNAGAGGIVIDGLASDSKITGSMVRVDGAVTRCTLTGHTVLLGGSVDKNSTISRVPSKRPLPPPRRF